MKKIIWVYFSRQIINIISLTFKEFSQSVKLLFTAYLTEQPLRCRFWDPVLNPFGMIRRKTQCRIHWVVRKDTGIGTLQLHSMLGWWRHRFLNRNILWRGRRASSINPDTDDQTRSLQDPPWEQQMMTADIPVPHELRIRLLLLILSLASQNICRGRWHLHWWQLPHILLQEKGISIYRMLELESTSIIPDVSMIDSLFERTFMPLEQYQLGIPACNGGCRISQRRGRQPSGGYQDMILLKFAERCMTLKKSWSPEGGMHLLPPLRSATGSALQSLQWTLVVLTATLVCRTTLYIFLKLFWNSKLITSTYLDKLQLHRDWTELLFVIHVAK